MSYLLRGVAARGGIRVIAADTTYLAEEARERHGATPTAGAALGRTLTGALLLSHVLLKNLRDRVTLRLCGDGPLGGVIADAGLDGAVRGYVKAPDLQLKPRPDGKLDVGSAIGRNGEIEVIRSHAPYGELYSSSARLASGEVAEDIASFLAVSEQILSAVLLGVYFERGRVARAGGIILQALPGADPTALERVEGNVRSFRQLTEAMGEHSLLEIMDDLTYGLDFELLTERALPLHFECRCSEQKALDAVAYFQPSERNRMIEEDGGAEVVCHWCREARWLTPDAIWSISGEEIRCPSCGTLWYREGQAAMIRTDETCACGLRVTLPA